MGVRHVGHVVQPVQRPDSATSQVAGLLHRQQGLWRGVARAGADGVKYGFGVELTGLAWQAKDAGARQRPRPAALAGENVGGVMGKDFVAGPAVGQHRDLVAHGAGGQEHGGLLAQQRRHPLAQGGDGRVVAVLLVPNLGRHHGGAHRLRGAGLGVGIEIDAHRHAGAEGRRGEAGHPFTAIGVTETVAVGRPYTSRARLRKAFTIACTA